MKKSKIETRKSGVIYLEEGMSLADIIKKLMDNGVTDLSKVVYDHDYVGCCGGHVEGEYYYCPSSYTDMGFKWEA